MGLECCIVGSVGSVAILKVKVPSLGSRVLPSGLRVLPRGFMVLPSGLRVLPRGFIVLSSGLRLPS